VVGGPCGADHARATGDGELHGGAADPACGAVDEQGGSSADAEFIQAAGGRFERDGKAGGVDETQG